MIIRIRFVRGNVITRFYIYSYLKYLKYLVILQFLSNSLYVLILYSFFIYFLITAFVFAAFANFIIINSYVFKIVILISVILFYKSLGLGIKYGYIILAFF